MYPLLLRVQFNDLWIKFHNSSWNFHEAHFSRKHFTNHIELTEHKIMVLKPTSKYKLFGNDNLQHCPFLYWAKVLETFFTEPKISNWSDQTINCSNIYLLFYLLWCQKSISWNYSTQGSLICPVVWKYIILKN